MAHSYHHALSSAKRFGGEPDDYLALHSWLDASKTAWADQRHRAVLHHNYGIYLAEEVFGLREEVAQLRAGLNRLPRWLLRLFGVRVPTATPVTITTSSGRKVPIRLVAEQHVIEDCGFIPTLEQYLGKMPKESWMYRGASPLHRLLDTDAALPELHNPGAPATPSFTTLTPLVPTHE